MYVPTIHNSPNHSLDICVAPQRTHQTQCPSEYSLPNTAWQTDVHHIATEATPISTDVSFKTRMPTKTQANWVTNHLQLDELHAAQSTQSHCASWLSARHVSKVWLFWGKWCMPSAVHVVCSVPVHKPVDDLLPLYARLVSIRTLRTTDRAETVTSLPSFGRPVDCFQVSLPFSR